MIEHMHKTIVCVVIAIACVCPFGMAQDARKETPALIPLPVSIEARDGSFLITAATSVVADEAAASEASKLIEALAPAMGFRLNLAKESIQH